MNSKILRSKTEEDNYESLISFATIDCNWDVFVESCADGHHEQTSLWGKVKSIYGWNPMRVLVKKQGEIVGGSQMLIRKVPMVGNIGYICKGPIVNKNDPEVISRVVRALQQYIEANSFIYVVVEPYNGRLLAEQFMKVGFVPHPRGLPPSGLMEATLYLDICDNLDSLLAQMSASTRKHIRRGLRQGVRLREGSDAELELFRDMMYQLCRRRGVSPTPPQTDFFHQLWKVFHPAGYVKLFLGEYDGEVVNAIIAFTFGDWIRVWKIGWSGQHANCYPNAVLYWEIIKWAKEHRYHFFDFVSIDGEMARDVLEGKKADSNKDGATYFKMGFGGKVILLQSPVCYFYNQLLRLAFNAGGARLLNLKKIQYLLNRIRS